MDRSGIGDGEQGSDRRVVGGLHEFAMSSQEARVETSPTRYRQSEMFDEVCWMRCRMRYRMMSSRSLIHSDARIS